MLISRGKYMINEQKQYRFFVEGSTNMLWLAGEIELERLIKCKESKSWSPGWLYCKGNYDKWKLLSL